jgi:hypothetical protein
MASPITSTLRDEMGDLGQPLDLLGVEELRVRLA